jgi:hypothetical protein
MKIINLIPPSCSSGSASEQVLNSYQQVSHHPEVDVERGGLLESRTQCWVDPNIYLEV